MPFQVQQDSASAQVCLDLDTLPASGCTFGCLWLASFACNAALSNRHGIICNLSFMFHLQSFKTYMSVKHWKTRVVRRQPAVLHITGRKQTGSLGQRSSFKKYRKWYHVLPWSVMTSAHVLLRTGTQTRCFVSMMTPCSVRTTAFCRGHIKWYHVIHPNVKLSACAASIPK